MYPLMFESIKTFFDKNRYLFFKVAMMAILCFLSTHAYADNDILAGTDGSFWSTFKGTGRKLLIGIEGIAGLIQFIATRKVTVFIGLVTVILVTMLIFKLAGA